MKIGISTRALLLLASLAVLAGFSPAQAQDAQLSLSFPIMGGKVQQTFDRGIYTYMDVAVGTSHFWVIAPVCGVRAGDTVDVLEGKYTSSVYNEELGITFDNFVVPTKLNINGDTVKAFAAHDLPAGCVIRRPAKK